MYHYLKESIWFERKFDRIDDNRLIPNILERLIGTPTRVALKVKNATAVQLNKQWSGRWSVKEEIGHLYDLEDLWIGRVIDFMEGKEILREADLTNKKTHEADHSKTSLAQLIKQLTTKRAKLINSIELLESDDLDRVALHPRLKTPMKVIDLLFFVAEHDDHHLARMTRILDQ